jgi:selT/selW/selH-like putative selenoprotein
VAAEIAGEFQSEPEMIKGGGGIFIVTADGKEVWNKKAKGRFPDPGEITTIVKSRKAG